jgi:hypothetical protein
MQVWGTSASACESSPPDGGVITTVPEASFSAGSGSFTVNVSSLPGLSSAQCNVAGGVNVTDLLCAQATFQTSIVLGGSCTSSSITPLTVELNTAPPPVPVISVQGLNQELLINVTSSNSGTGTTPINSVTIYFAPVTGGTGGQQSFTTTGSANVTVTGLTNGVTYAVHAVYTGTNGLPSQPSNTADGTPEPVNSFYANFVNAGGNGGGCSAPAGAAAWTLLPIAALWLFGRRRS